ncbi:MAG: hypothetical protein AB2598_20060 [Candidatus Thiodiazotropha sp.]
MKRNDVNNDFLSGIDPLRVERRWKHLFDYFNHLKELHDWGDQVVMNKSILTDVCWSYFIDIERHKHFHGITRIERYKISAFTTKWLRRLKPVSFNIDDPNLIQGKQYLYLNEILALRFGFSVSKIDTNKITSHTVKEALYTFHYRTINEEMLSMWYKSLGASEEAFSG